MSAFPAVCASLVSVLKASGDLSGVSVYDGIELTQEFSNDGVAVGHDGTVDDDDVTAGSWTQDYAPLGAKAKYEDGTVNCFLWSLSGDTDVPARRTRAFAVMAAVEGAVKSDPTLGGACMIANVASADMGLRQTTQGVAVLIPFTVTYKARLA